MTAPEPVVPELWWSPSRAAERPGTILGGLLYRVESTVAGRYVTPKDLPDDAVRLVAAPTPAPPPDLVYDDLGHFHGVADSACEHRTVGSHRAWCHSCGEWCYPSDPCPRCQLVPASVPETQETDHG